MAEIDPYYIKAITALHSKDHLLGGKPTLQVMLEEAIKTKTGQEKNFSMLIQTVFKATPLEEFKAMAEESKTTSSSDNELELDLFKDDLMCIVCQGMDVGARNRLLECSDCHCLYHQECHQPAVTQQDAEGLWVCTNCKESKRSKKSPSESTPSHKSKSSSSSHKHSSSYKSSSNSSSSSSSKSKSGASSSSSSKSSVHKSSSSSKHTTVSGSSSGSTDKQGLKKKSSKPHDKRKMARLN